MPKTQVKTGNGAIVQHTYSQKQKDAMDAYLRAHQAVMDFENTLLHLVSKRDRRTIEGIGGSSSGKLFSAVSDCWDALDDGPDSLVVYHIEKSAD